MGRHSMPDPEDSADSVEEPADEFVADDAYGEAGNHHADARRRAATDDYADEYFPAGAEHEPYEPYDDDYAVGDTTALSTADDYPEFPPRQGGPASSEPAASPPSLFRRGHRGLSDWRGGHRSDGGRRGVSTG